MTIDREYFGAKSGTVPISTLELPTALISLMMSRITPLNTAESFLYNLISILKQNTPDPDGRQEYSLFEFFDDEPFVFWFNPDFDLLVDFERECTVSGNVSGHINENFAVAFSCRLGWPIYYSAFAFQHFGYQFGVTVLQHELCILRR